MMSAFAALPRRERFLVGAGLLSVTLLAWAYLFRDAAGMGTATAAGCMRMQMAGPEFSAWPVATLPPLFAMWAIMMVAMMLPSALPMVLTFAAVARNRRRLGRPYVPVAIFVSGYLIVWCAFSAVAAVGQWLLHRSALLSAGMASTSALFAGLLLLAAGVFQFTPLKRACLTHCRSTFEFIMTRWREGSGGALRMGLEHGTFCTGCCWALMTLLFVVGVMNLFWIAALTALVCVEKMLPARTGISSATGVILLVWGVCVLAR
ncbi:MAG: DUF2182 domain-containing protein [Verrucomicrobiota bacterium]|nr:DUF2182 domain-containing protein [Verrucomicrobiota bacterium]